MTHASLWPEILAGAVLLLATLAESLHVRRSRRLAFLAFGREGRSRPWARAAPGLRVVGLTAVTWGLVTLIQIEPKVHRAEVVAPDEFRHVILVLDVSPSMRLQDAGPQQDLSRTRRASEVMRSFFRRVPIEQYRISVVAVYSGAKPVVVDTTDMEVVSNILSDLPMEYAFTAGDTDIFAGLEEAARIARPWKPQSTTVMLISDGDTVPATGMPRMPAAVADMVVVGVGDPVQGKFIDGRQSRQDSATLRQIAARLQGTYHNGNEKHLSSELLARLTASEAKNAWEQLGRREFALIAVGLGGSILALLPWLLHLAGSPRRLGRTVPRMG